MTFFNKKEEVIDLKITRFGKNLLSRGAFKPVYYKFFDDDVIYDITRTGASEEQNDSEPRIKSDVRLKTQHLAVSVETSFDLQTKLIEEEQRGVFLDLKRRMDPKEEEKILKYPLSSCAPGTQLAPSFKMIMRHAHLTGTLTYTSEDGMIKDIPQLQSEPEYIYYVDRKDQISTIENDQLLDSEDFLDTSSDIIEFNNKSKIAVDREDFIIDIQEFSSFFGRHNFEIEFFEETADGSGTYVEILDREKILEYFVITTDEEVEKISNPEYERNRSYFSR